MLDPVRKLLGWGLDRVEGRAEQNEDRNWEYASRGLAALDNRSTFYRFFLILLGLEAAYLGFVILAPDTVLDMLSRLNDWSPKGLMLLIGVIFGTGLWLTYSLFRMKIADLEEVAVDEGPIATSFFSQRRSERRFRIWIVSTAAGVLNVLALYLILHLRVYGW